MKKILIPICLGILFTGCLKSPVKYSSDFEDQNINDQYIEHSECTYFVGPFNTGKSPDIKQVISNTIIKGNDQGMYGDELVNISVEEGTFTALLATKLCVYVKGNIVYKK